MIKIDKENQEELKKILEVIKLPSIENVGYRGTQAIWLVAQHAVNDLAFMKHVLGLIQQVAKNNLKKTYHEGIPYLVDRINMKENKPQVYGTQFTKDQKGKIKVYKVINMESLDKRRAKFGLEPFRVYEKAVRQLNKPIKYAEFRTELLELETADQKEITENFESIR